MRNIEHQHQCAFMQWCRVVEPQAPELALMFAVPNGSLRHPAVAAKLRAEGVKPGVPDLFLPVARFWHHALSGHDGETSHGLFIEMKSPDGRPSKAQQWWHDELRKKNYEVAVCHSVDEAIAAVQNYLGFKDNRRDL